MDKVAFIAVGVFMIASASIAINTQSNLNESGSRLAGDQYEILARNAAVAGLDRVKQMLADNFGAYDNVTGINDGLPYIVNAVISGDEATVHSVSTFQDAGGDSITFNVKAKFKQRTVLPSEAPQHMRYAVISDEDLVLRGNVGFEAPWSKRSPQGESATPLCQHKASRTRSLVVLHLPEPMVEQVPHAAQLVRIHSGVHQAQKKLLGRAPEKPLCHAAERALTRGVPRHFRRVPMRPPFRAPRHVRLALHDLQHGEDRVVGQVVLQGLPDLGDGRSSG